MSIVIFCGLCGTRVDNYGHVCPQLDSIVPARMPEQSSPEPVGADSSVPGDSRVKVSDFYAWMDTHPGLSIDWEKVAHELLTEVRRLEHRKQNANG